jgi:hypothetical protein
MADTAPKPYQLSVEHRPDYLYVYIEGEHDSYMISRAYWTEISLECERVKASRLMVDENLKECVSVTEMYQIASEIPGMFSGIAIAFVDRHADQAELNEFGELVALNRGVTGKFFVDAKEAEEWLLSK